MRLTLTAAAGDSSKLDALDKALAGRVPGTPVSCIDSSLADGPQIIDNRTLIYRGAGRLWRNTLPDACPSLTGDVILVASKGGHPSNPLWLENMVSEPESVYTRFGSIGSTRMSA